MNYKRKLHDNKLNLGIHQLFANLVLKAFQIRFIQMMEIRE